MVANKMFAVARKSSCSTKYFAPLNYSGIAYEAECGIVKFVDDLDGRGGCASTRNGCILLFANAFLIAKQAFYLVGVSAVVCKYCGVFRVDRL